LTATFGVGASGKFCAIAGVEKRSEAERNKAQRKSDILFEVIFEVTFRI
jgi:hypothetical protein